MAALRCSKIPAKIFSTFVDIQHVLSQIPYQRKTETSLQCKQTNSVTSNGEKNTTNGIHQHHYNYLNIYVSIKLSDILWYFLRFMG